MHETEADLREQLRVLRARKWGVLGVAVLVVTGAMLLAIRQTPIYRGTSQVLVEPIQNPLNPYAPAVGPNLETERQLVDSQAVGARVRHSTHATLSTPDILDKLQVDVLTDTDVLSISYDDSSAATAATMANAFAQTYLKYRTDQAVSRLTDAGQAVRAEQDQMNARLRDINNQLSDVNDKITNAQRAGLEPSLSDKDLLVSLQSQRASLLYRIGTLVQQYAALSPDAVITQTAGEVLQPAATPSSPVSPDLPRTAVLAVIAGLALGIAFALLRERLDDRVKGRDELEHRLGAPVVAAIPRVGGWRNGKDSRLVMVTDPKSPVAEAYRTLATNIQYLASQRPLSLLLITSAAGGEGKTTTTANLAVALAQTGRRVILVSADMRRPRVHQFFGIENRQGFSNLLSGTATLPEVAVPAGIRNLRIIPAGPTPENPAGLLGGRRATEFLASVPDVADFVLLDAPPALAVADASVLAPRVDGTLYVIHAERSGRSAIHQARSQLENAGATLVGGVYNDFDPSKADSYAYYHSYYYAYYGIDQKHSEAAANSRNETRRRARRERAVGFDPPVDPVEAIRDGGDAGVLVGSRATTGSSGQAAPGNGHHADGGNGNGSGREGDTPTDDGLPLWWASPEPGPS